MGSPDQISSSKLDATLQDFETKLDRLYRTYEQYFIGVEHRPPRALRRQVQRLYRELEQAPKLKTSMKFRFRSLAQRFNSYKTYWNRTEREIEQGTYHRDLARAKARQDRRRPSNGADESANDHSSGEPDDDGVFELEDDDLDLQGLEDELAAMDDRGEFEKYVGTKKVDSCDFADHQPPANPAASDGATRLDATPVGENVKQKRLAELQAKLGLSTRTKSAGAGPSEERPEFSRRGEGPTQKARPENPSAPDRGADLSKLRRLRRAKQRIEQEGNGQPSRPTQPRRGQPTAADSRRDGGASTDRADSRSKRVIQRRSNSKDANESGDAKSRKIYNELIEAKRRCKEDTSHLNYNSFKRTMDRQRTKIQKSKGARGVDFKVVIKRGQAFLKPETKK